MNWTVFSLVLGVSSVVASQGLAQDRTLHTFERIPLTDVYFSEGANAGDINRDGHADVVYGPHWYAGPDFKNKHELYPPKPQNRKGYADNFFSWIYDFNGDGWNDVLVVGLPGTPAFIFENPTGEKLGEHWKKHTVFPSVGNESPHFVNLVGDAKPELVCTHKGSYGFVNIDWTKPFETWTFQRISDQPAPDPFGHGLGVGDVNGDGRNDILCVAGWLEQPKDNATTAPWTFHAYKFGNAYGGADMFAYDVDGDGDNDVITSLAAHDFGLAWFENVREGNEITFRRHLIMGDKKERNPYGLVFSELHSVALADIDGDGLKDIITGKTYYSHHESSPMWDAGAVVYWFKLNRTAKGVEWIPYKADGDSGIGRQLTIADVNGDKLPDIVVGGMVGGSVLIHKPKAATAAEWKAAQPTLIENYSEEPPPRTKSKFTPQGKVEGAIEAEELTVSQVSAGQTAHQDMGGFPADKWSGGKQLFWTGAKPGETLELELPVATAGTYDILAAFTMARDYAIVKVALDGQPLRADIDLYNSPEVITTGEVLLGKRPLEAGKHRLAVTITGANPAAAKVYMVGLDYVLIREKDRDKK
ncbi:MAG: VCBS repeat-containing protein [Planctomycetes bacterium]|nr:VCBS repeat-containing protein [Planctomycetota bacterium]